MDFALLAPLKFTLSYSATIATTMTIANCVRSAKIIPLKLGMYSTVTANVYKSANTALTSTIASASTAKNITKKAK